MGTRSLTHVKGDVWEPGQEAATILTFYQQYDGYPSGVGKELAEFLAPFTIVNGLGSNQPQQVANGMGCLAAQLIAKFKTEAGGLYIHQPDATDCGEEYVYTVYQKGTRNDASELHMRVYGVYGDKVLYDGPVSGFDAEEAERAYDRD